MSFHRLAPTARGNFWWVKLIRSRTFCVVLVVAHFACPTAVADDEAKQLLLQRIEGMDTFQADFLQQTLERDSREIQQQKGMFVLKRPDSFLWQVNTPFEQTIIIRGQDVSIFDPDLEQLIKQRLDNLEEASLATLLTHSGDPLATYEVLEGEANEFTLRPLSKNEFLVEMQLTFEGDQLHRVEVFDSFDNTTVFNFYNTKLNESVDDSVFELDIPEGTDVIIQEGDLNTTEI